VSGHDAFTVDPHELRRKVVLVSQEPNPFPHITIFDNVALPARLKRIVKSIQELHEVAKRTLGIRERNALG